MLLLFFSSSLQQEISCFAHIRFGISILIVALLPVVGFFLYVLIRPARTIKERELEALLLRLVVDKATSTRKQPEDTKGGVVKKKTTTTSEDISL